MATIDDLIAAADKAASGTTEPTGKQRTTSGQFIGNEARGGIADSIGGVLDLIPRAGMLAIAGAGVAGRELGLHGALSKITGRPASNFMPEVDVKAANYATDTLRNLFGVAKLEAPNDTARYLGAGARAGAGSLIGGPGNLVTAPLKGAFVGTVAGLTGEAGGDIVESMGGPRSVGTILGGMGGGTAASSFVGPIAGTARVAKTVMGSGTNDLQGARPLVQGVVDRAVKGAAQNTPNAAANIDEALAVKSKIPGFNPSVAEMADSPGLAKMQSKFALSNPAALNAEVAREQANLQAITRYYEANAPGVGRADDVRAAINRALSSQDEGVVTAARELAKKLPTTDLVKMGDRMAEIAMAEKAAARPAINAAYAKAFDAAGGAPINATPIIAKVEEILGQPLTQIKPESAPQTVSLLRKFLGTGDPPQGMQAEMTALAGGAKPPKTTLTLQEADELRKAINADFAATKSSMGPMTDTRLLRIKDMHKTIDDAVTGSTIPQEAKDLYAGALNKYRTEYAPRFKEGTNVQMFRSSSKNEPQIIADRFIDSYFKPDSLGGGTRAGNFAQLFGKSAEARDLTRDGILDRFRAAAVDPVTGAINHGKAAEFAYKHARTLDSFKKNGVNAADEITAMTAAAAKSEAASKKISDLATKLNVDSAEKLIDRAIGSQSVMGNVIMNLKLQERGVFARQIMDRATASGTAQGLQDFLTKNKETLKIALKPSHLESLDVIARARVIAERAPVGSGGLSAGTDPIKNSTGVTAAMINSQIRSTTGNRQSWGTMGLNLAAPVLTKLGQTQFSEVMKVALHDERTAINLRNMLTAKSQPAQTAAAMTLLDGLKSGAKKAMEVGAVVSPYAKAFLGTENYAANIPRALQGTAAQVQSERE